MFSIFYIIPHHNIVDISELLTVCLLVWLIAYLSMDRPSLGVGVYVKVWCVYAFVRACVYMLKGMSTHIRYYIHYNKNQGL